MAKIEKRQTAKKATKRWKECQKHCKKIPKKATNLKESVV